MSDTWQYANWQSIRKATVDICAIFREILDKASSTLSKANLVLTYSGPEQPVYCLADVQMLERAIYNLLSNSIKFSEGNCVIDAKLSVCGNMLHFSVADTGKSIPSCLNSAVFSRFLREPGIEDGIFGIGLGMMLIRSVAAAHGGSVFIDQPQDGCNRVTMTMEINTNNNGKISETVHAGDYSGGRDHALLELSDILPAELYDTKKY
jgi:signal transduction histidine kinase